MTQPHDIPYLSGFENEFATEARPGALPARGNSPQKPPLGLYPEQISGTAFTVPRAQQRRTWLYRIRPSVVHGGFQPYAQPHVFSAPLATPPAPPNPMRWDPVPFPGRPVEFIDALITLAAGGDAGAGAGLAVHLYAATASMRGRFFYNADGEMLIVPQEGALFLRTEMGRMRVAPGEIALIPRGVKFAVDLPDARARGYVCENYGAPFTLPDLGPIGANGLAYPRHFLSPVAAYEDGEGDFTLIAKADGALWAASLGHSPLDVVAWHGNLAPCKYDLANFMALNTVTFDHADPSIFTVLTSKSDTPGVANADFVIFPPRWSVAEETFRPPYFHRNVMSEFMGLIRGVYDAKEGGGFAPGGASLHPRMAAHGPDAATVEKATGADLKPARTGEALAFMFESRHVLRPTAWSLETPGLQRNYADCWRGLKRVF